MTHEELDKLDFSVIAEQARRRGKILVPVQYVRLLQSVLTTGFWPVLYDADGKELLALGRTSDARR